MKEEMKMQENDVKGDNLRVHRVGTITAGVMLVVCGILFILHQFMPDISYELIFRLWPCVLIAIGAEILAAGRTEKARFVYDTGAVALLLLLSVFAMCMAGAEMMTQHAKIF